MDTEWLAKYSAISSAFMSYGWFVPPYMLQFEFDVVEEAAEYLSNNPPQTDQEREEIEYRIYRALCEPVFNTGYRARAVWYSNQLKHLCDFNHLHESAIFSYYKREYAQSVVCLLTALEGVLLSIDGYDSKGTKFPNTTKLIETVRNTRPLDARHEVFRDTLARFLEMWIYKDHRHSDFRLSVLNRHYVLHGMDAGNFYRPQDLHRLILAFDLLIEYLAPQQHIFHIFSPDPGKDAFIDVRRDYYQALAMGSVTVRESWKTERALLKQHARYIEPKHDPDMLDSFDANLKLMIDLAAVFIKSKRSNQGA